jgi:hypothetical protein
MEPPSTLDFDLALDQRTDEERLVRAWRAEQLRRLGLPPAFSDAFADFVDWHELAALVGRGCPPLLALDIVR